LIKFDSSINKNGIIFKFFLFFIISLIIISSIFYVFFLKEVIGFTSYPVDYTVGEFMGVNLDEDSIHFGVVLPGAEYVRSFDISSLEDAKVNIYIDGIDNLFLSENNFIIKAEEVKNVELKLVVPSDAEKIEHKGLLRVVFRKVE
jgi:hypothetical protein